IKHIHFHLTLQLEESNITLNRNFYDLRMI
ncbi:hypothetical protein E1M97_01225, partial [Staphylococcus epidermidis]